MVLVTALDCAYAAFTISDLVLGSPDIANERRRPFSDKNGLSTKGLENVGSETSII